MYSKNHWLPRVTVEGCVSLPSLVLSFTGALESRGGRQLFVLGILLALVRLLLTVLSQGTF